MNECIKTKHECLVSEQLMYPSCSPAEADLRIGELRWGDSGVYFCKVIIADDLEGKNEGQLELLVLGRPVLHIPRLLETKYPRYRLFLRGSVFVALHSRESFQQHPWRRTLHELHTVDVLLARLYLLSKVSSPKLLKRLCAV